MLPCSGRTTSPSLWTEDNKPTDNAIAERVNGIIKVRQSIPEGVSTASSMQGMSSADTSTSTTIIGLTWVSATNRLHSYTWSRESRKRCGRIKIIRQKVPQMDKKSYLCRAERQVRVKANASNPDCYLNLNAHRGVIRLTEQASLGSASPVSLKESVK